MFKISNKGVWKDLVIDDEVVGQVRVQAQGTMNHFAALQKLTKQTADREGYELELTPETNSYEFVGPSKFLASVELSKLIIADYLWTDFKWKDPQAFLMEDAVTGEFREMRNTVTDKMFAVTNCEELNIALGKVISTYTEEQEKLKAKTEKLEETLEKK